MVKIEDTIGKILKIKSLIAKLFSWPLICKKNLLKIRKNGGQVWPFVKGLK